MDSGIESPEAFQLPSNQLQPLGGLHNMIPTPRPPTKTACKQNDHTTKEKLRRYLIGPDNAMSGKTLGNYTHVSLSAYITSRYKPYLRGSPA